MYGVASGTATITYTLPTGCIVYTTATVNPVPSPNHGFCKLLHRHHIYAYQCRRADTGAAAILQLHQLTAHQALYAE